jgi:hypothetical protein
MFIFVSVMFYVGCAYTGYTIGRVAYKIFDKIFGSEE